MKNDREPASDRPPALAPSSAPHRHLIVCVAYGILYYLFFDLAAFFGLLLGGSLWFPAAGLRLVLFLVYGPRLVPGIMVAELVAVTIYGRIGEIAAYDEWIEILQVAPTTLLYGIATFILTRFGRFDPGLSRPRDVVLLLGAAVFLPFLAAAESRLGQVLLGTMRANDFLPSTMSFFIGDTVGILMLTPLLLAGHLYLGMKRGRTAGGGLPGLLRASLLQADPRRLCLDFIFIWGVLFLLHALPRWLSGLASHVHWYMVFLPLIWISFRNGLLGSIIGAFAVDLSAAWLIYLPVASIRFQELQILLVILSATSLLMGAVVSHQRVTAALLRRHNEELQEVQGPLITIRGFLGLLRRDLEEGDTERVAGDMARIESASLTMGNLLDELLDLSRLGRDRRRLLQLMQNLIDNAVKFKGENRANGEVGLGFRRA